MISGITSNTSIARGNRSNIKFSVNQRIIKNSSLVYAVETAYSGLIEPRRFPFTFINIKIDPELIDVNVHPAKTEIKFTQEELDSLQSLRESATRVESDLGRLEIARINVEQRLQGIDNQKIELETRYLELQKQEVSIAIV